MTIETVFELPDGSGVWAVRGYEYPDADTARAVWEKIEEGTRGKGENFSIWRTMNPQMTQHFVVVCGRPENLPEVPGGKNVPLHPEAAKSFALRRAKRGKDWFDEHPSERLEEEVRYGEDNPQVIDRKGDAVPYRG